MSRRVLVVGSGSREHALAWSMSRRPKAGVVAPEILVAPGNPGMRDVATIVPDVSATDAEAVIGLTEREHIELVVVGPEAPLVLGLADRLAEREMAVFGPSRGASALEGSKAFCREVASEAGVTMADGEAFDDPHAAADFARRLDGRVAVKADGLAAGKGVTVCTSVREAESAIRAAMVERVHGIAGARVVVERALEGPEASVICICDATACLALPAARDHKRLCDGDRGPNTGGMGAYSPLADLDDRAVAAIVERVHRPVLAALARRGIAFRGALYAGLMLTAEGPVLLEFNVRFGDPETQALLPRLDVPLEPLLAAAASDRLAEVAAGLGLRGPLLPARPGATVAIVLAAPGYPDGTQLGEPLEGLDAARASGCLVFTGGVSDGDSSGRLVTAGGRVLTVVGEGADLAAAADAAYAGAERISFPGRQLRRDIGRAGALPAGRPGVAARPVVAA